LKQQVKQKVRIFQLAEVTMHNHGNLKL